MLFKDYGYPTGMLREANTQQDGWYKVRVTGYAYQSEKPITFELGATTFARGLEEPTFGYFELTPGAPQTVETRVWIPARYMIKVTVQGITDRFALKSTPVADYRGPGLAIQHIEVEGPLTDEFPSRGHRLIFDGLERTEIPPRNPADRTRPRYQPKFQLTFSNREREVPAALERVATAAFRRPVTASDVAPYVSLFQKEHAQGSTEEEALRTAVTAIFCSPEFLYLNEPAGPLDDYALASRLSYFLTRTTPDADLLEAARAGRLRRDPSELRRQFDRLLKDPRSSRMVVDFTDAWLNLRRSTLPFLMGNSSRNSTARCNGRCSKRRDRSSAS